jgi:predicted phage terminase large subunit-like protein
MTKKSAATQAANRELASRILSRRRLLPFIERMNPKYMAGWVHEDICRRLEQFSDDVAKGLSPRLMLLMPPRAGKSEIASKTFPAWHLGRHPDHEIIACSYNVGLAMDFSKRIKALLEDPTYQTVFDARLDPDNKSSESWGLHKQSGSYVAAGVGGGINGKGAHVLIIDDPLKNAEEADSATTREAVWNWYGSTAYTRLAPGGGVLIIQTWWHDDDLAGRLQQEMANAKPEDVDVDRFVVVKYPAIAEQDEWLDTATDEIVRIAHSVDTALVKDESIQDDAKLRAYARAAQMGIDVSQYKFLRAKGEALHPDRFDLKKLNGIKRTIPARFWSALYQQNPVPDDGAFFTKDQFKRGPLPSRETSYVHMAWDFAISTAQHNDYTVGSVALQDEDDVLHVAEVLRFKSNDSFFIVESILDLAKRWYHPSLRIGVEDGQIWRSIEALLKKRMKERAFYPSIVVLKPISDKQARASAIQGRMQQGMVSFNENAEWYDTVRSEMLRFPAGVHDDCVDSLAWMAQLAVGRTAPQRRKAPKTKSWRDKLNAGSSSTSHMAA